MHEQTWYSLIEAVQVCLQVTQEAEMDSDVGQVRSGGIGRLLKSRAHCVDGVGEAVLTRGKSAWRDTETCTSMAGAGNSK